MRKAVVLINVGTPDNPDVKSVRKYLFQFLNDRRVINIPWILQKILVNFIIVPFRAKKSTELYKLLWNESVKLFNENISPLLYNSKIVAEKLQIKLDNSNLDSNYKVFFAMRYGNPSLKNILAQLKSRNYSEIIFIPLFPQYASSTTGTVFQFIFNNIKNWTIIPKTKFVNQFYNNNYFIDAFVNKIQEFDLNKYEHIIFSFHGLPNSHINTTHSKIPIESCTCEKSFPNHGTYCYKATCYETTRLIASKLNLSEDSYSVSFQSRLTKDWLSPFTDQIIINKAKSGIKNILIIAPSFVSDCLETLIELQIEYNELFKKHGGNNLTLVRSLNDSDEWIDCLYNLIFH